MSVKGLETGYILIPPQTGAAELALVCTDGEKQSMAGSSQEPGWFSSSNPGYCSFCHPQRARTPLDFWCPSRRRCLSWLKLTFPEQQRYLGSPVQWCCSCPIWQSCLKVKSHPRSDTNQEEIILSTKRNRSRQSVQAFEYRGVLWTKNQIHFHQSTFSSTTIFLTHFPPQ